MAAKPTFKAVLLGEGRVGKTSIGIKYTQGTFDPERPPTVKAGFYSKQVDTSGGVIELNLWDTAGQEEYHAVAPVYYKNAEAALLVYSVDNASSFDKMRTWRQELHQLLGNQVKIFVVGNKIDLANKREVTSDQGVDYANSIGCSHFEVSAKTGEGLEFLFRCVAEALVKGVGPDHPAPIPRRSKHALNVLDAEDKQSDDKKDCC
jgi:small GTP-binding protein